LVIVTTSHLKLSPVDKEARKLGFQKNFKFKWNINKFIMLPAPTDDYDDAHSMKATLESLAALVKSVDAVFGSLEAKIDAESHRVQSLTARCRRLDIAPQVAASRSSYPPQPSTKQTMMQAATAASRVAVLKEMHRSRDNEGEDEARPSDRWLDRASSFDERRACRLSQQMLTISSIHAFDTLTDVDWNSDVPAVEDAKDAATQRQQAMACGSPAFWTEVLHDAYGSAGADPPPQSIRDWQCVETGQYKTGGTIQLSHKEDNEQPKVISPNEGPLPSSDPDAWFASLVTRTSGSSNLKTSLPRDPITRLPDISGIRLAGSKPTERGDENDLLDFNDKSDGTGESSDLLS
jgi:hypothetical protein